MKIRFSLLSKLAFILGFAPQDINSMHQSQTWFPEENRLTRYERLSKHIESLDDDALTKILDQGESIHSGWAKAAKIMVDGTPVFVKKLPLNEVEGRPENINSTRNLFDLPTFYQYGVGSGGFSIWREVEAHKITTNWVLQGDSQNFPMMYHSRILKNTHECPPMNEEKLATHVKYWEGSEAIGNRRRANHCAPAYVAVFLEYLPYNVNDWLEETIKTKGDLYKAFAMIEKNLIDTTAFMKSKRMLHFDAHFKNILTDGERLYFSDFGLTTSTDFSLSEKELQFFRDHQNYDRCYVLTELVDRIIYYLWDIGSVEKELQESSMDSILEIYAKGEVPSTLPIKVTPNISSLLIRYAPLCHRMNSFFYVLRKRTKNEPYPAKELDERLDKTMSK